ncbi:MAG: ABC transporter substrate-binding protein [Proteobacteria bacterium]|nr:ABC transporter substrate-binding protein [Pseudomonadota bacterium]MBI3497717.1 ABC transporter substrate-binding protein [Pseudomonadota bacterium]
MITRRIFSAAAAGLILTAWLRPEAGAAESPEEAQKLVKQLSDDAIRLLTGKDLDAAARNLRFRELLTKGFDVPAMARFVLGRYWRDASEPERQEYLKLFEDLIVTTYAQRFADYQGESFKVTGAQPEDDKVVLVQSHILRQGQTQAIRVDWRVLRTDNGFKIVDVVVEGVSLSVTQRSEFASVIQRNGGKISGLLDALRSKTKELQSAG